MATKVDKRKFESVYEASKATGKAPTKRLRKRRRATRAGEPGYYANPQTVEMVGVNPRPEIVEELEWLVRVLNTEKKWVTIAGFMLMRDANLWGQAYADRYPKKTVSIQQADWA